MKPIWYMKNGYAVTDEGAINTETAINNESWVWNTENLFLGAKVPRQ